MATRERSAGTRALRWALIIGLALGVAVVLGAVVLFSGSEGVCAQEGGARAPRLRCELVVAAAPGVVWEALTRTDEPRAFYFDAVLEAEMRPGGRWRFVTDDRARLLAGGEILELDPPRRFAQTFEAADLTDPPSRITVEIEPLPSGSRLTLIHDRFGGRTTTYRRFRRAHPLALAALKSLLEEGRLPWRARLYTLIFKPGMKLFTVRAEPWEPS